MTWRSDPPNNQMAFPGLGIDGDELMKSARQWVATHYEEWQFYCRVAREDALVGKYKQCCVSSDSIVHAVRRKFKIKLTSDYTAPFARIFLEQCSKAEYSKYRPCFDLRESKVDTFTRVNL